MDEKGVPANETASQKKKRLATQKKEKEAQRQDEGPEEEEEEDEEIPTKETKAQKALRLAKAGSKHLGTAAEIGRVVGVDSRVTDSLDIVDGIANDGEDEEVDDEEAEEGEDEEEEVRIALTLQNFS